MAAYCCKTVVLAFPYHLLLLLRLLNRFPSYLHCATMNYNDSLNAVSSLFDYSHLFAERCRGQFAGRVI